MEISIAVGEVRGPLALDEFIGQVQSAADSGFGTVWSAQALGWDALTALAVAGALVPDLALGTAVVPTPQRHPLTLASQALTVQAVTGNRLTLGIGAGIGRMVESMFGLPAGRPARRMREYVSALRPLLRGEAVDYRGETLTAVGAVSVSGAHAPPLLLAALGPEMLRVAGELADGAVTWMAGPRTLADHVVPTVTRAAETAGRPAPRILAGVIVCVTDDEEGARARIGERFAMAGSVPEYRAVLDREHASGPQDVVVVGDETRVEQQLRRLADAGVTECFGSPFGTAEEEDRTTRLLATLAASGARTAH